MRQSVATAAHCINPGCPRPYPQNIGNNFCNICGSSLRLKNRYIPLEKLGLGGFAAIYSVWDLQTNTERVLKVLLETSPKALAMFEQEAMVLANLPHPGVPRVESDGYFQVIVGNSPQILMPCLVMEKISGQTLEDVLKHHPQGLSEKYVLNWLKQAVHILRELHLRQIIHRDIKPSNLMLRQGSGQLVLIDFGGAKQIGPNSSNSQVSSTRLFSPGYSPAEQITGGGVGPSADFYALGMTFIHLLTGQYPPDLEDPRTGELRWRQHTKISPGLASLLDEMVRPDAVQRPSNAREIIRRLGKISPHRITIRSLVQLVGKLISQTIRISLQFLLTGFALIGKWLKWFVVGVIKACLGTAWGLVLAKSLGQQQRQYLLAGIMGAFGYSAGWLILQRVASNGVLAPDDLVTMTAMGASLIAIGLGLPSHQLVHVLISAVGTSSIFAVLVTLTVKFLPLTAIFGFSEAFFTTLSWTNLAFSVSFFSLLGAILGWWLGISYYLCVPLLRWLGWR